MSISLDKPATTCADCFHPESNHVTGLPCSGSLICTCEKYNPPFLFEFAQRVEEEKHKRKTLYKRVKWLLEELPTSRNAGERTFYKIYIELWEGFKIRKGSPQVMDSNTWKRLPNQDSVNREKRRVKHDYPELATYDKEVLLHQTAIYQALLELSADVE